MSPSVAPKLLMHEISGGPDEWAKIHANSRDRRLRSESFEVARLLMASRLGNNDNLIQGRSKAGA